MKTKLTQQQEEYLPRFREEYLKIGLDTTPIDFDKAEQDIRELYKLEGMKPPKQFVRLSSPMMCELYINKIKNSSSKDQPTLTYSGTWFNGQQDAYWIAFYQFAREIGVNYDEKLSAGLDCWLKIMRSCHWFYPYEEICIISDRPRVIHMRNGRLHNEIGKSVEYSDGWGIYSLNGRPMPGWIIDNPELITLEKITSEKNAEVRREMMRIYGWDRMRTEINAVLVDKHPDPFIGELWSWQDVDGVSIRVLKCQNGTVNPITGEYDWYTLRVPTNTKTAVEANRWTYPLCRSMSDEEYIELSKTRT